MHYEKCHKINQILILRLDFFVIAIINIKVFSYHFLLKKKYFYNVHKRYLQTDGRYI